MKIECNSEYSGDRFSVNWSDDTYRYHVWVSGDGSIDGETAVKYHNGKAEIIKLHELVYKNKIDNPDYHEEGHYDTRVLNFEAKTHAATRAKVLALIEKTDLSRLYHDYRKKMSDQRADEKAKKQSDQREKLLLWAIKAGGVHFAKMVKQLSTKEIENLKEVFR